MNSVSCAVTLSVSSTMVLDFSRTSGEASGRARDHLRLAADDVQRIARLVREAGGGEVQFLQMRIQLARAHEADLQVGGAANVAPREARAERGDAGEKADDEAQPQIMRADGAVIVRGHGENQAVQFVRGDERLEIGFGHPAQPRRTMVAAARAVAFIWRRGRRFHFAVGAAAGNWWRKIHWCRAEQCLPGAVRGAENPGRRGLGRWWNCGGTTAR